MSASFADWLIDTFIYTGLLIGLVLILRRPVSRHFGAQIAYTLWALPLLRFLMPPIVLPASMAPAEPAQIATSSSEPLMVLISDPVIDQAGASALAGAADVGISLTMLLLPVWLVGTIVFLAYRARNYARMRRDLLAKARPVGEAGKIRLVETPAVSAPVAFGVLDKVIALPPGFMAHHDLAARDMVLAHELAHHRGHDLLANILAQPILALHWFNPLAWWGWRAMRRDQEAACDARVVAGRGRAERAAYAQVIAGFAAGDDLVLAAPMACPVLGEKSIIHRLRSLTMSDISTRRRRIGIAAITTSALALPLTASISYAHPHDADAGPAAPTPPLAPVPPAPPRAPDAPLPPAPPQPPALLQAPSGIVPVDPDAHHATAISKRDGRARTMRTIRRTFVSDDGEVSEQEFAQMMAQVEAELESMEDIHAEMDVAFAAAEHARDLSQRAVELSVQAQAQAQAQAHAQTISVEMRCEGDQPVVQRQLADGRQAIMVCRSAINAKAVEGIERAREAIAANREMAAETRQDILRSLDREIERLHKREQISANSDARKQRANTPSVASVALAAGRTPAFSLATALRVKASAPLAPVAPQPRRASIRLTLPIALERVRDAAADACEDDQPQSRTA